MTTAVVIGGGVVGMASALQLQRNNVHVTVVDPIAPARSASWGNAGHVAIEQIEPLASPATIRAVPRRLLSANGGLSLPIRDISVWAPFVLRLLRSAAPSPFAAGKQALGVLMKEAMPAWVRFAAALSAPELLRQEGHFILWGTCKGAAAGRAAWRAADTGTAHFHDADESDLARLRGLVGGEIGGAIRCVGTGQISDPDDLADAMKTGFSTAGGVLRRGRARALVLEENRAALLLDDGSRVKADIIVVAAGVDSRSLMEGLAYRVPMIAERGYHVQYPCSRWPQDLPPLVFEDRSMIVTRFRSGVRVSGYVEFAAPDRPADAGKWRRLRAHVSALELPLEPPGKAWMGARPTLPDYLPAIGRSRRAVNLLYAFGHQHLGLTLAPVTGELVAALALGGSPAVSLRPFDLERFQTGVVH